MSESANDVKHPGPVLRAAREEQGLTQEEVAERLHLRPSVVALIESESYEDVSGDVFLKGYFRSYCRLVGLHEERMVELLEAQLTTLKEQTEASELEAVQAHNREKNAKTAKVVASTLVVIIVIVAFAWFVLEPSFVDVDRAQQSTETVQDAAHVDGDSVDVASIYTAIDDMPEQEAAGEGATQQAVDELNNSSTSDELEIALSNEKPLAADLINEPLATSDTSSGEVNDASTELSQVDGAQSVEEVPQGPPVNIEVAFTGECWFEAYDGAGQRISADLMKEGRVFRHQGFRPVRIILGDGNVAQMTVDGQVYDFSSKIRSSGRAEVIIE